MPILQQCVCIASGIALGVAAPQAVKVVKKAQTERSAPAKAKAKAKARAVARASATAVAVAKCEPLDISGAAHPGAIRVTSYPMPPLAGYWGTPVAYAPPPVVAPPVPPIAPGTPPVPPPGAPGGPVPVPEPGTLLLFALAAGGMGAARCWKGKR